MTTAGADDVDADGLSFKLQMAHQQLVSTLDGVCELVRVAVPHLQGSTKASMAAIFDEELEGASAEDLEKSLATVREVAQALGEAADHLLANSDGRESEASDKSFDRSIKAEPRATAILVRLTRKVTASQPDDLVVQAAIPLAVGGFEMLVAQIMKAVFRKYPGALGNNASISLSDLNQFTAVGEAVDFLVERKVDALLFEGFDGWVGWFNKHPLAVDLPGLLSAIWPDVLEIVQRRHVIIHNGSRVSKRYRDALMGNAIEAPAIGTVLRTEFTYALRAVDLIAVVGHTLWAHASVALNPMYAAVVTERLKAEVDHMRSQDRTWCVSAIEGIVSAIEVTG